MSREESRRLHLIKKAIAGEVKQSEVSELVGISSRQIRRLVRRVRSEGDGGIVHGLRGRTSNRKYAEEYRRRVVEVYHRRYEGFGPTLASEKLKAEEGERVGVETLRKWLGVEQWGWQRRRRAHRRWRERKSHYGVMVQMDGSHHDWLEGRGPWMVLMGYIDDATGRIYARFYDYEGTFPAMDSFRRYIREHGIPQSMYADKHTTYQSWEKLTVEDELEGKQKRDTQFGRVLKELQVTLIPAHSPQAKGRVERLFKTLQDRLVKELRLRGITTKEEANRFLDEEYLEGFNKKYGVVAKEPADVHRRVPKGINLDRIFCIKERRVVRNDFTVVHNGQVYQINDRVRASYVTVEERMDGRVHLYLEGKRLRCTKIDALPVRRKEVSSKPHVELPDKAGRQWIPPRNHPWRRFRVGYAQY